MAFRWIKNLLAKWLVYRDMAVDIWSTGKYPANVLSNLCNNEFVIDGVRCGSMEGFLQSLKTADEDYQLILCRMNGKDAKRESEDGRLFSWRERQRLFWRGEAMLRQSEDFDRLVSRAYRAMFEQNRFFREALMSTKGKRLYHCRGGHDPKKTILTEQEFCRVLTEIRDGIENQP